MGGPRLDLEVVDLDGPRDESAARIDAACTDLGFFRIPMSVVPLEISTAAWDGARRFFEQADHVKLEVAFPEPDYPYGWSPLGFESLSASIGEAGSGDLKESYSVGPDCLGPAPALADPDEAWIRSPSLWPTTPADLRAVFTAY